MSRFNQQPATKIVWSNGQTINNYRFNSYFSCWYIVPTIFVSLLPGAPGPSQLVLGTRAALALRHNAVRQRLTGLKGGCGTMKFRDFMVII